MTAEVNTPYPSLPPMTEPDLPNGIQLMHIM
jgi:hypothetical protein